MYIKLIQTDVQWLVITFITLFLLLSKHSKISKSTQVGL